MKIVNLLWLALMAISVLVSCTKEEIKEDPQVSQGLIGLWRGMDATKRMVHVYNLKENREAVYTAYDIALIRSSLTTVIFPPWMATTDVIYFGENATLYNRQDTWVGIDGSQLKEFPLFRIYNPATQRGTRKIPGLTGKTWTGYYNDRVITLEFKEDHTVIRTDKPNAGWEGSTQVKEYVWEIENNVIRFEGENSSSMWGVGLETDEAFDLIYVNFDNACCALGDFY